MAAKGKGKHTTLTNADLLQLQERWSLEVPGYGLFHARFAKRNRRLHHSRRLVNINDWEPNVGGDGFSREEKKWQKMDGKIVVRGLLLPRRDLCLSAHWHIHTRKTATGRSPIYTWKTDNRTVSEYRTLCVVHPPTCNACQEYASAEFAGYTWHVEDPTSTSTKDNSIFRMDYKADTGPGRRTVIHKSFARVKRIFEHVMFPGGPSRVCVEGAWYKDEGVCPIAGTQLVSPHPNHHFTHESKFIFINQCYQQPVALWPYDPKDELRPDDPKKAFFDVIDRNEEQQAEEE